MTHTHEYDCIICGRHLDSSQELDRHNKEQHQPRRADNTEPVGNDRPRSKEMDEPIG